MLWICPGNMREAHWHGSHKPHSKFDNAVIAEKSQCVDERNRVLSIEVRTLVQMLQMPL